MKVAYQEVLNEVKKTQRQPVKGMKKEIDRLRKVLSFYSNIEGYYNKNITNDGGRLAREILKDKGNR